jgi:hypothetical protein
VDVVPPVRDEPETLPPRAALVAAAAGSSSSSDRSLDPRKAARGATSGFTLLGARVVRDGMRRRPVSLIKDLVVSRTSTKTYMDEARGS